MNLFVCVCLCVLIMRVFVCVCLCVCLFVCVRALTHSSSVHQRRAGSKGEVSLKGASCCRLVSCVCL